jgi:hypothetical protein
MVTNRGVILGPETRGSAHAWPQTAQDFLIVRKVLPMPKRFLSPQAS